LKYPVSSSFSSCLRIANAAFGKKRPFSRSNRLRMRY
jgi:hypothetical protein